MVLLDIFVLFPSLSLFTLISLFIANLFYTASVYLSM
jgi:hypothetical protein